MSVNIDFIRDFNESCLDSTVGNIDNISFCKGNQDNSHFRYMNGDMYYTPCIEIFICKYTGQPISQCSCCNS
jgi:hypothetical protein